MSTSLSLPALVSGVGFLPPGRRAVLEVLKRRDDGPPGAPGGGTAEEVAEALEVTVSAARQQLQSLERQGLVVHVLDRSGAGRPRHRYALTGAGEELFPRRYSDVLTTLMDHVEAQAPEVAESYFQRRTEARVRTALPRMAGSSLESRVRELVRILNEDGYDAEVAPMGEAGFRLVERNCAILAVAQHDARACASELAFFRSVLPDARVERTHHVLKGHRHCAYTIEPQSTPQNQE